MADVAFEADGYIAGRRRAPRHLGRVLVLGLGKSGKAAANYCHALLGTRVDELFIAAGGEGEEARAFCTSLVEEAAAPCAFAFGNDAVPALAEQAHGTFDVCIASPGIPYWETLYQDALEASAEVVSEVEFAWRESRVESVWVAITGTNGKTTTTACCASILEAAGMHARAVGNIGDVCLDAVAADDTTVYVAEVSSYQLASTVHFAPNVAVLLNITPDHIHWHRTLEAYRDAKFNLLAHLAQTPGAVAVLDATNDVVRAKVRELKATPVQERGFSYIPLGTAAGWSGDMRAACGSQNAAFIRTDGTLVVAYGGAEHVLCSARELRIHGLHNASNALAAAAAAIVLGVNDREIADDLRAFAPLEHRIEPCGTVRGVALFNDSKATNVDATLKALAAFPDARPIVLLGGDDKGTDLAPLVAAAYAHTRACVCFGEAAERFARAFEQDAALAPADYEILRAAHLEDALDSALAIAHADDVVLLSPACASFDEFRSFEERGSVFKRLVSDRVRAAAVQEG